MASTKVDSAIHQINHSQADSAVCFVNTYPLDSDKSGLRTTGASMATSVSRKVLFFYVSKVEMSYTRHHFMKISFFSRGGVVNQDDLYEALKTGQIWVRWRLPRLTQTIKEYRIELVWFAIFVRGCCAAMVTFVKPLIFKLSCLSSSL